MIEKMKSVCMVARASQREEALTALRNLGIMHIAEKKAAEPAVAERFSVLSHLITELQAYKEAGGTGEEKPLSKEQLSALSMAALDALERKATLSARKTELTLEAERLKPWGDFDSEAIKELSNHVDLHFYRLDKKTYRALTEDKDLKFIKLASVEKMETVAVIGTLDKATAAIEFTIPEKDPLRLRKELDACQAALLECEKTLRAAAVHVESYRELLLKTQNEAEYSAVDQTLSADETLIWLSGYIPEAEVEKFTGVAKEQNWAWAIREVEEDDALVPTKIRYNKLTSLTRPIFDILGVVPGYREYDISFWFLAFFALFFAMIIGDAGYGSLFLIGTIIWHIKAKKLTNITLLLYLLSGTTIVWGALTGTWLGLEGAMQVPLLRALVIPSIANYPSYFAAETTAVQNNVMKFCFSIGLLQLGLACIMNIRKKCAAKSLGWIADVGWLFSISALYLMVLNLVIGETVNLVMVGTAVGAGFLLVVLFGGMAPGKTFSEGLKAGLSDAFTVFLNTISAFGNVMSYIRLFAVGMASLAIAQSFNDMAAGFSGVLVVVGIIIMAVGHLLNIVMGFLSVVVHGVRLNLLEFSGQLGMEWSGTKYQPFKKIK